MDPLKVAPPAKPFLDPETGAWMISRYSDVSAALRDPRLRAGADDPEWHARYRQQATLLFGAPGRWATAIQNAAMECRPASSGRIDVVEHVIRPWSRKVACLVTGLPLTESAELQMLASNVFAGAAEPSDESLQRKAADATQALVSRFPGEFAGLRVQAFVALCETLAAFVGNAWFTLLSHGLLSHGLLSHQTEAVNIEELLRYAGPSKLQLRHAAQRMEIDGVEIPDGATVMLDLASANRDPQVFADPDVYDPGRRGPKHLAFGSGAHACSGAALITTAAAAALRVFEGGRIVSYERAPGRALRSLRSLRLEVSSEDNP